MSLTKTALLSALSVMAATAPAAAQQVLTAPGITILVSPAQPQPQLTPDAFQIMNAQMAQMNDMMQQMNAQMSAQMAAMSQPSTTPAALESLPQGVSGFAITTITDGAKSCTARVLYPAAGAPQKIQVSESGNDCAALRLGQPGGPTPVTLPAAPVQPKAPTTIVVKNDAAPQPIRLADRD